MTSTAPESASVRERIPAAERRELILIAATELFGSRGFSGTTTDQIAKAAGISQPYVVRMFGTKEALFLEAIGRALEALQTRFRAVVAASDGDRDALSHQLGNAYVDLVADRNIMRVLMQAFLAGSDPVIGPAAREGFLSTYRLLRDEAGFSPEEVRGFLAHGMLLNTLLGLEMPALYEADPDGRELLAECFGHKLDLIIPAGSTR
ncbi:TetR/AcrR family transcriptional regulator [Microbacteriaceae bacterium VKM Ac-2854]|nr:TetR/AcrR family transcriptional regulator [Microbacteriaceae bacterium VKM Ac-2854]